MFVLSEALLVVPAKLVHRILQAEYIDMSRNNGSRKEEGAGRQARQEVPDILSWLQCFGLYAAGGHLTVP